MNHDTQTARAQEAASQPGFMLEALLMARLALGDMAALSELVQRHQQRAWQLAYRVTGRRDMADDIVQDAFLRVLRSAAAYQPSAAFSTWLYRIVSNLCLDALRRPRLAPLPVESPGSGRISCHEVESAERAAAVQREVAALPDRQRLALVLHRFDGLSLSQIGQALGCSVSAVESLLTRAYAQLRRKLADWRQ